MLYGKIPVALLSAMASEKNHSTNSVIAAYMLTHREQLPHMKIQQLAAVCHVSVSSVSRFCREIGLQDFSELHEPTAPGWTGLPWRHINRILPAVRRILFSARRELCAKRRCPWRKAR